MLTNNFNLIGRVVESGIRTYGKDNNVGTYTVASRSDYKDPKTKQYKTEFIPVTVFAKDFSKGVFPLITKGKLVAVSGRMAHNQHVNKDGQTVFSITLIQDEITLLANPKEVAEDDADVIDEADVPVFEPVVEEVTETPKKRAKKSK